MALTVTSPAFVGRRRELEHLGSVLAGASEGRTTTVFVEAVAGLGATRLIDEVERRLAAERQPFVVLRGTARPVTRGDAFAPVREAILPAVVRLSDRELRHGRGTGRPGDRPTVARDRPAARTPQPAARRERPSRRPVRAQGRFIEAIASPSRADRGAAPPRACARGHRRGRFRDPGTRLVRRERHP